MTAISNSEMASWTRCPRQWFLRYYLGFIPAHEHPVSAAKLGTRVHTSLEALYGYGLDPLMVLKVLYGAEIEEHSDFEAELRSEWELANAMVSGYMEWAIAEGIDADMNVMSTEQDVRVPLPGLPGVELRARLDQAVQEISTGWVYFRDWKTAGNFDTHQILELNPQFRLYSVIMHLRHGIPFDGPVPDGLIVPAGGIITTLRRVKRTEKSKPPYYQQDTFRYSPEQLHATLIRAQTVCAEIMSARARMDESYQRSEGALPQINAAQRSVCRPVPLGADCSWRCDASKGLCVSMDDGADWPGMLLQSGRWVQGDPYAYYEKDGLAAIRTQLASL